MQGYCNSSFVVSSSRRLWLRIEDSNLYNSVKFETVRRSNFVSNFPSMRVPMIYENLVAPFFIRKLHAEAQGIAREVAERINLRKFGE